MIEKKRKEERENKERQRGTVEGQKGDRHGGREEERKLYKIK